MINFTHRAVRAAGAAATLLGVVVLASPVMAGNSKTITVASSSQAMTSPASADPMPSRRASRSCTENFTSPRPRNRNGTTWRR